MNPLSARAHLAALALACGLVLACTQAAQPAGEDIAIGAAWQIDPEELPDAGPELPDAQPEPTAPNDIKDFPEPEPDLVDTTAAEPEVSSEPDPAPEPDVADVQPEPESTPEPDPVSCCLEVSCEEGFECDEGSCGCEEIIIPCDPADCAFGEGCNIATNECEQIGQCGFIGQACDPVTPDAGPMVCVAYGDGTDGICREQCIGPPPGDPNPCLNGICAALPNTSGWCLPEDCSGFFQNDCGPDATCLPSLDGSNFCVPNGDGVKDDLCDLHNECGMNLLCIDQECEAPNCSPFSQIAPCEGEVECVPMTIGVDELDIGTCAIACEVFLPNQCPDGSWCYPNINTPEPGPVDGHCTDTTGNAPEGTECLEDPNACGEGLSCVQSKSGVKCEKFCDPDAEPPLFLGACPPGRACQPLILPADEGGIIEVFDFGSCVPACETFVSQEASGCALTNWCAPFLFNGEWGDCSGKQGVLEEFGNCDQKTTETTCKAGLLCSTSGGVPEDVVGLSVCRTLCIPELEGTNEPGDTCGSDQFCDALVLDGATPGKQFEADVGFCSVAD